MAPVRSKSSAVECDASWKPDDGMTAARKKSLDEALASSRSRPCVVVVRPGGLGDTILLLPGLQLLHALAPEARLVLVGSAWAEAILPLLPFPINIRRIDSSMLIPLFASPSSEDPSGLFVGSDAVILCTADPDSCFCQNAVRLCPGPVVLWPSRPPGGTHAAAHFAGAFAVLSRDAADLPTPSLRPPADLVPWARRWLDARLAEGVRPLAVHPGSGGRPKCWSPAGFAHVIARLGVPTLLLEGPADAEACDAVAARLDSALPIIRAPGLPIPQVAALLCECRLYVGNDSGMSHLAAALGVPTAAVFGPTDPSVWGPLGNRVERIRPTGAGPWPQPDEVLEAAMALQRSGPGPRLCPAG